MPRQSFKLSAILLGSVVLIVVGWRMTHFKRQLSSTTMPIVLSYSGFPTEDSLPWNKFALFIGIDKYPQIAGAELSGCVRDAHAMKRVFVNRFGFKRYSMLIDGQATRAGIGVALTNLINQVTIAKDKTHDRITVVITYAGHGSRVRRLPGESLPGLDSTWVPYDGVLNGDHDIRGAELFKVLCALRDLGAQVILISDSCHSGTVYRSRPGAKARQIPREARGIGPGPAQDLFATLPSPGADIAVADGMGITEGAILPGFVHYAACSDDQQAYEMIDPATKENRGKFSYVMEQLLRNIEPDSSYQRLADSLIIRFNSLWPNDSQIPEFHAAVGKSTERFLSGGYATLHARIVPGSIHGSAMQLSMGSLHGVSAGDHFGLYANIEDLVARQRKLGSAEVTQVAPLTCDARILEPEGNQVISGNACAALDTVSMMDFSVGIDGTVPEMVRQELREMDARHQLRFASAGDDVDVLLHYSDQDGTVGIYYPTALPPEKGQALPSPRPIREVRFNSAKGPDELAQNLLYIARIRRIMTLDRQGGPPIAAEILNASRGAGKSPIVRVFQGERFTLRLHNKAAEDWLYATVLAVNRNGEVSMLYPKFQNDFVAIAPGSMINIPGFEAEIDQPDKLTFGHEVERTLLKVFATTIPIDFTSLLRPPATTRGALAALNQTTSLGPGASTDLFKLVRKALHGGSYRSDMAESIRGGSSDKDVRWSTTQIIFDVAPKH